MQSAAKELPRIERNRGAYLHRVNKGHSYCKRRKATNHSDSAQQLIVKRHIGRLVVPARGSHACAGCPSAVRRVLAASKQNTRQPLTGAPERPKSLGGRVAPARPASLSLCPSAGQPDGRITRRAGVRDGRTSESSERARARGPPKATRPSIVNARCHDLAVNCESTVTGVIVIVIHARTRAGLC